MASVPLMATPLQLILPHRITWSIKEEASPQNPFLVNRDSSDRLTRKMMTEQLGSLKPFRDADRAPRKIRYLLSMKYEGTQAIQSDLPPFRFDYSLPVEPSPEPCAPQSNGSDFADCICCLCLGLLSLIDCLRAPHDDEEQIYERITNDLNTRIDQAMVSSQQEVDKRIAAISAKKLPTQTDAKTAKA